MKFLTEYLDDLAISYIEGGGNLESITKLRKQAKRCFMLILAFTLLVNIISGPITGIFCVIPVLLYLFAAICVNELYTRVEKIDAIEKTMEEAFIKDVIAGSVDWEEKE